MRDIVHALIDEGELEQTQSAVGPIVHITPAGEEALDGPARPPEPLDFVEPEPQEAEAPEPFGLPAPPPEPAPHLILGRLLDELLECDPERAKTLADGIAVFHPRKIAAGLAARYDAASTSRQRARVAWAAGELCGHDGLPLLIRCAKGGVANVRRLAASAMGKVFASARTHAARRREDLLKAQQALAALQQDPAPQVREYAEKAISELLRRTAQ